jgi:hypothetical protein
VLPADAVRQQAAHLLPHQLAHLGGRQRLQACTAKDKQRRECVRGEVAVWDAVAGASEADTGMRVWLTQKSVVTPMLTPLGR